MSNAKKLLNGMRRNPRDWRIEDLEVVAAYYGIPFKQHGTSHVIFRPDSGMTLSVPAARPIKPPYIRQFVAMIDNKEGTK